MGCTERRDSALVADGCRRHLYNCTHGIWRMNRERAGRVKYFFAVCQGVIKEVHEVHKCIPVTQETKEYWRMRMLY